MTLQVTELSPNTILSRLDQILAELLTLRTQVQQLVTATNPSPQTSQLDLWAIIKAQIAKDQPELLTLSATERRQEFERLSAKIVERMPYKTVDEFEQAMRGDTYGLTRY